MKKTPRETETPAAADPATTQPPPAVPPAQPTPARTYLRSDASRVAFLLETAPERDREFFNHLLDEWEKGDNLPELALLNGAHAYGIHWITEADDLVKENETLYGLAHAMVDDGWLARFLRSLLKGYDYQHPLTPDDVAEDLEGHLIAFQYEIRDASKLIRNHPETVAGEIRETIRKRPDLLSAA
jgi:hypothetical protein